VRLRIWFGRRVVGDPFGALSQFNQKADERHRKAETTNAEVMGLSKR
jgi:nitrogen fixation protein FixH